MSVIRGEYVRESVVLSASGELFSSTQEPGFEELIEEECRKAFKRGEEKGEKIGYAKAQEESRVYLNLLQTLANKLLMQKNRLLDQLKPELIAFAIKVCERLIRRELSQNMVKLINSLLKIAAPSFDQDVVDIILSPEDLALIENQKNQIQYPQIVKLRFLSDSLMRRGDCRIETKTTLLNYDISRELAELQLKVLC